MELDLNIDLENIAGSFERIADDLMNKFVLKNNENSYRIAEIEFYFKHEKHEDTYTHGHALQKQMAKWYIHASGMDITFGNAEAHGGILIRALSKLDDTLDEKKRYVYGPLNSLMEVMKSLGNVLKLMQVIF